jgi:hypothetical protein
VGKELLYPVGGNVNEQSLCQSVWRLLKRLKIELPSDPARLLGRQLTESKSAHSRDTCTPVFAVALPTGAKLWGQPRCPSADGWIRKRALYTSTMEF